MSKILTIPSSLNEIEKTAKTKSSSCNANNKKINSLYVYRFDKTKDYVEYYQNRYNLTEVIFDNIDASRAIDIRYMFYCANADTTLTNVQFPEDLNTDSLYEMSYMFYNRRGLKELDLTMFDTDNLFSIGYTFYYCSGLTNIDVSTWNTPNLNYIDRAFAYCTSLTKLNLMSFTVDKLYNSQEMFYNCTNLRTIYATDWSSVKTPNYTGQEFRYCNNLVGNAPFNSSNYGWDRANTNYYFTSYDKEAENVVVTNYCFNTMLPSTAKEIYFGDYSANIPTDSSVLIDFSAKGDGSVVGWLDGTAFYITSVDGSEMTATDRMQRMFYANTGITKVVFDNIDTSNVVSLSSMFYNCTALVEVDMSNLDILVRGGGWLGVGLAW